MASTVKAVQMQMATVLTDWKPTQGKRFGEFSEGLSGFTKKRGVCREKRARTWETRFVPVIVCIGSVHHTKSR
jgi:hypothetical protein